MPELDEFDDYEPEVWRDVPDDAPPYSDTQEWVAFESLSGPVHGRTFFAKLQNGYRCFTDAALARHNTEVAISAFKEIADNMQPDEIINREWLYDLVNTLESGLESGS